MIQSKKVFTLDLQFMGMPGTIASYLIPHTRGVALVECGPSSTKAALIEGLHTHGFTPANVTDVLLTHIHLDHAGAAGWLARQGARIHVHPVGAPHLREPGKLLASARRIYGDSMDSLWGEFLPVPGDRLSIPKNGDEIEIGSLRFRAVDTPGHSEHHFVYLFEDLCFSGDIGGVRLPGHHHIRLPMPPPDFHLGKWRSSVQRLRELPIQRIAPTHFGIFSDANRHLVQLERALDEVETWIEATLSSDPPIDDLNEMFLDWYHQRALRQGLTPSVIAEYEAANPSWMSSYGIHRYWKKVHDAEQEHA
jgi:glyoxylase-like metal-dependent hydrolase (beta-lactamase superfamily II)